MCDIIDGCKKKKKNVTATADCFGLLPVMIHDSHDGGRGGVQLVDKARNEEDLLWYTSTNPDTPLHVDLPLNTAVALPISLDVFHRDLCFVFFAEHDVNVSPFSPPMTLL